MASLSPTEPIAPQLAADRWTAYSLTVWAICMLGFAFDIYESTIMQLVTPLLIKEWASCRRQWAISRPCRAGLA